MSKNKRSKAFRMFMAASLAPAMVVSVAAPTASAASASDFSDVDSNAWYFSSMDYLVGKGVLNGYSDNTLRPSATLTRAEAATMLVSSLNMSTVPNPNLDFSDTSNNVWYSAAVATLVNEGVIEGFPDGTFRPNDTVTRAEFSKMIVNAYELTEGNESGGSFPDLVSNAWYMDAINVLTSNGIVQGKPSGNFDPNANVLRSESATFIYRTEMLGGEDPNADLSISDLNVAVNSANVATVSATVNGAVMDTNVEVEIFEKNNTSTAVKAETINASDGSISTSFKELPVGEYIARVSSGDVSQETEFEIEQLVIDSVQGITTSVDASADGQFLKFKVNGENLSREYLTDMGYTLEFLASQQNVLANAATGELDEANLTLGNSFDYQVKITGNDVNITSDAMTVSIESFATKIVGIDDAEIHFSNDVKSGSKTISTEDSNVTLANIAVEYGDGGTTKLDANHQEASENVFTFASSDATVALINADGKITPVSDGTVTFTITSGSAVHTIDATVSSEARKATEVTTSKDDVGLVVNRDTDIAVTVKDQFGDPVKGFNEAIADAVNSNDDVIATAAYTSSSGTDKEGKAILKVTADNSNEGTGTLEIKNSNNDVLKSLDVKVDADTDVASRALDLTDPMSDFELDVNPFADDDELKLTLNEYNAANLLIGGHDLSSSSNSYTIVSSDEDVFTLSGTNASNGTFTVNAVSEGTAKVQVKEGTIVRYEKEITVEDTTPTLAGASFQEELKIDSTSALKIDDIIGSLTFSGEKGSATTKYNVNSQNELIVSLDDGTNSVDVATLKALSSDIDDVGFYTSSGDHYLGDVSATPSGFASGTEGTIVLRLNKTGQSSALITTTVPVDID